MSFQGLQNGFPILVTVIVAIAICVLVWNSYKKYDSIPKTSKWTLISLRTIALLMLLFLLMNPFFKKVSEIIVKPKVALLLDSSQSVGIDKGDYKGLNSYNKVVASLKNSPDDVILDFYKFGGNIQSTNAENINLNLSSTNIYNALEHIITSDDDYVFAGIITDGIITIGKNPVILAADSPFPIHTVALGDTNNVKDVSISNINTNATGFTNTKQKVSVEISQFGFDGNSLDVTLESDDEIIDSKTIQLDINKEIENVEFEIELNEAGLKQYKINLETIEGEWIKENNESVFSIEILDSKKRILHVASEIHPDVKMIQSILSADQNIELSTYYLLGKNRAFKQNLEQVEEYDLVILHGNIASNFLRDLNINLSETATLYMPLSNSFNSNINNEVYSLLESDDSSLYEVQISVESSHFDHPILELPDVDLQAFPPLLGAVQNRQLTFDSQSLLTSTFQNVNTNASLLSILEVGNVRRSEVNAFGWYKIYLSPNNLERDYVTSLFNNLIDWTSSNPDNRLLKVKPIKSVFNSGEEIVINGSLINENGSIESSGVVEVHIEGDNFSSDFTMTNSGNGNYQLNASTLPDGSYNYTATARKGSREIDVQTGEFLVTQSNIELSNTIRNDNLLKGISANSGGQFLTYKEIDNFWNYADIQQSLATKTELREEYIFPIRSVLWFIIVIVLLASEWLLRKKFALP